MPASSRPLADSSQPGDFGTKGRANTVGRSGQKLQEGGQHPLRLGIGILLRGVVVGEGAEHDPQTLTSGILQGQQSLDDFGGDFRCTL